MNDDKALKKNLLSELANKAGDAFTKDDNVTPNAADKEKAGHCNTCGAPCPVCAKKDEQDSNDHSASDLST